MENNNKKPLVPALGELVLSHWLSFPGTNNGPFNSRIKMRSTMISWQLILGSKNTDILTSVDFSVDADHGLRTQMQSKLKLKSGKTSGNPLGAPWQRFFYFSFSILHNKNCWARSG